jgi:disulfide oxidoreductase YuzD
MELILVALIAGATAAAKDTASVAVKDAYEALKALIKKKFEKDALAQAMVDAKPEEIKQAEVLLKNKITEAGIDKDDEIKKAAEAVEQAVKESQGATGSKYNTTVGGDMKIGIQGDVSGGSINQTF